MPSLQTGPNYRQPFGKNVYLRGTSGNRFKSHMCAKDSVIDETTAEGTVVRVLQPGTVMAKITSGVDVDKVGPFDDAATDGRQDTANIVGVCDTFLPTQLQHRDVEVAIAYEASVVANWCRIVVGGAYAVPTAAVMTAMASTPTLKFTFH